MTAPTAPTPLQKALCDKYGLAVLLPDDMIAVALATLGRSPIYGTRIALPEGGNVSWFIHCGDYSDADDFYQPVHTEHLPEMLPRVMNYLCLPAGARFIIDDDGYEDVWMEAPSPGAAADQ
ncbi:immunity protein Imm33 domain-containing protein [Pseudomonas sp. NPDC089530]|uniref:immunity protein Imm33 domain-containing protein n=1 Tax=Pseudomonas sp. NPDC089530 TaxID=3390651 RepID=UPI003D00479E